MPLGLPMAMLGAPGVGRDGTGGGRPNYWVISPAPAGSPGPYLLQYTLHDVLLQGQLEYGVRFQRACQPQQVFRGQEA